MTTRPEFRNAAGVDLFAVDETGCERCGKPENGRHFGLCCACVEHGQEVQDVTEARHEIVIDAARDVIERVPGATRRLRAVLALRDGDDLPVGAA